MNLPFKTYKWIYWERFLEKIKRLPNTFLTKSPKITHRSCTVVRTNKHYKIYPGYKTEYGGRAGRPVYFLALDCDANELAENIRDCLQHSRYVPIKRAKGIIFDGRKDMLNHLKERSFKQLYRHPQCDIALDQEEKQVYIYPMKRERYYLVFDEPEIISYKSENWMEDDMMNKVVSKILACLDGLNPAT